MWPFSCYAHEREGQNDITGDISPEEVRWLNMQAAKKGATGRELQAEFKVAERAKIEQFQALTRAHQAPSKGGPQLSPALPTISGTDESSVSVSGAAFGHLQQPFGSATSMVGQAPAGGHAHLAGAGFGAQHVSPAFGTPQQPLPTFGESGFGRGFGGTPSAFGTQHASAGFGSSPFGLPSSSPPVHQQQSMSLSAPRVSSPAASMFGAPAIFGGAAMSLGSTQLAPTIPSSQPQPISPSHIQNEDSCANYSAWQQPAFEKGKIPEEPPPPQYCV